MRNPALRMVGSLWFAGVLLMLLLVGMACATVYESIHTAEQALAVFYTSRWFKGILALIGVNVLASMMVRFPFSKRQIGFVLTHAGILLTLGGAVVTDYMGVQGHIALSNGKSTRTFNTRGPTLGTPTLTVKNRHGQRASVDLTGPTFVGAGEAERPEASPLNLGNLHAEVERFVPDSRRIQQVVDDHPLGQPVVEVSLSNSGRDDPVWLFAGKRVSLGSVTATFVSARSDEGMRGLLESTPAGSKSSSGLVKIRYDGVQFDIPLDDGLERAVPLGDTGATVRVLRYLPHALVENKQLVNKSNRPVNPAVEIEIVGPSGSEKRYAFAKFPEFSSIHGKQRIEGLEVAFVAPRDESPRTAVEVISGPSGEMYVRFNHGGEPVVRKLDVGAAVESPWAGERFAVLRRFERARLAWTIEAVNPVRKNREPALLLRYREAEQTRQKWIQWNDPLQLEVDGVAYFLSYENKIPLGFELTLDRANTSRYPGSGMPRTYESHITITDSTTGRTEKRVISMNRPVTYGGYSLYQSNMSPMASGLSVSRDPGKPIVFAGYVITLLGMVVALVTRMADRRKKSPIRN